MLKRTVVGSTLLLLVVSIAAHGEYEYSRGAQFPGKGLREDVEIRTVVSAHTKTDPVVLGQGERIIRGGGIGAPPRSLRSAARHAVPKDIDYYGMLGLRLVFAPKVDVKTEE